jgi:hypothetical protein
MFPNLHRWWLLMLLMLSPRELPVWLELMT